MAPSWPTRMGALFSGGSGRRLTSWTGYISVGLMDILGKANFLISYCFRLGAPRAPDRLHGWPYGCREGTERDFERYLRNSDRYHRCSGSECRSDCDRDEYKSRTYRDNRSKRTLSFLSGKSRHLPGHSAGFRFRGCVFRTNTGGGWPEHGIELFTPSSVVKPDSRSHRAAGACEPRQSEYNHNH